MNVYQYMLVDLSLLLSRNVYACSKGRGIGEYTAGEVVKMTIQTLNKIGRDYKITSDKIILLADTWDQDLGGYYRTWLLGGNYKDSRKWMTPEKLAELQSLPGISQEEIEKAKEDLYREQVKQEAKGILRGEAGRIGLPCIGVPGLEYDDLCFIISSLLHATGALKKSIIVTKDSDCMYCTSPVVDYFRLPVGGSVPQVLTYDDIYKSQVPKELQDMGVSLWDYKAIWDCLDGGHNDLRKTRVARTNLTKVIGKILLGDYSGVYDKELFLRQYATFKLENFPMITKAVQEVTSKLPTVGHIGTVKEFHTFCDDFGITGVSDLYYTNFIRRFETKLFTE